MNAGVAAASVALVATLVGCGARGDVQGQPNATGGGSAETLAPEGSTGTLDSIAGSTDAGPPPTLTDVDAEFVGRVNEYRVTGYVLVSGDVVKICKSLTEDLAPQCSFPFLMVPSSTADALAAAGVTLSADPGGRTRHSTVEVTLRIQPPYVYDQVRRTVAAAGAKVDLIAPDSSTTDKLEGMGGLANDGAVDISGALLSLGYAVSPSGGVQVYGAADGGFVIESVFPVSRAGRDLLTRKLRGPITLTSLASAV